MSTVQTPSIKPLAPDPKGWPLSPSDGTLYRILFINPPSVPYNQVVQGLAKRHTRLVQTRAMPMGILYLAAVLERDLPGVEIQVVDLARAYHEYSNHPERREITLTEFTSLTLKEHVPESFVPDFVGISVLFSTAHRSTLDIAHAVKTLWPNAPVVVGGMHATNSVPSLLECPAVDFVCCGEGESIITQFAKLAHAGEDCEQVMGIIGRRKLATSQESAGKLEAAPLVYNLDTIPFPSWHLLDMAQYVYPEHSRARHLEGITQDGEATIVTTRGCPFHCTFCSSWTVHGRQMRYRSIENVLAELTILKERYQVNTLTPEDDLFTVHKPRIIALCNAVADKFKGEMWFQFPNGLSVNTLDEEVIDAMKRMGMLVANIAIESGSPYVQEHIIKKNVNLDRARRVVQYCRDQDIIVRGYFIFGFPGETREQMQETFDFAASIATDWNAFMIASPLVGTEMYQQMRDLGYIDHTFNWDTAFFQERAFDTAEIAADELKNLVYAANIRINFFGNYNLRHGNYEKAIKIFNDILHTHKGHLASQYCIAQAYRAMGDLGGYERALEQCHEMLKPEKDPLAHELFKTFPDLFPDLGLPHLPDGSLVDVSGPGPRPGMPFRARSI